MSQFLRLACFIALLSYGAGADTEDTTVSKEQQAILGGSYHECYRECVEGDVRTCEYAFTMSVYSTMSLACGECPYNKADCYSENCMTGDGSEREVYTINRVMPAPSIQVCEGDFIKVNLTNSMEVETVVLHWHGIEQHGTPYMDGVPFVTQCPITPLTTFQYYFEARPAGTQFWHSHLGNVESDGSKGMLIVRSPNDVNAENYDYDLADHLISIDHWFKDDTAQAHLNVGENAKRVSYGVDFTVNGRSSRVEFVRNGTSYFTPRANFTVEQGFRYRFRSLLSSAIYCPVQVSIDNHTLTMIASESAPFESIEVESYIMNAGERYDFVLNANQSVGNYWIRIRGLGQCANTAVSQTAILRYDGADDSDPVGTTTYEDANRSGRLLNPVQMSTLSWENNTVTKISELRNLEADVRNFSREADYVFYVNISMNTYSDYVIPGPYPQLNKITWKYPPSPVVTQPEDNSKDSFCINDNTTSQSCVNGLCSCTNIYEVPLDSLVELVLIDSTSTSINDDHPIHMHGHHFYVIAMESIGGLVTTDEVKAMNEAGLIEKNFVDPPLKDTLGVPAHGYAVIRFIADNPGYWILHCHVSGHLVLGQALLFKVGEDDDMVHPPSSFPRCGSWYMDTA